MLLVALLAGCAAPGRSEAYWAFWSAFDERYAVFDARLPEGADWRALGEQHFAAMGDRPSRDALFRAMLGLARELDDGHVTLCGRGCEDAWVSVYPHYPALYALEGDVEAHYLDRPLSWAARDQVAWGWVEGAGYISLSSMDGLSRGGSERGDREAAREAIARALDDLGGARGLVVDIRANEGGWDSVSLDLAAWFSGPRALAWTEQVRDGPAHDDLSEPEPVHVEPSGAAAYAGPVVLLTSGGTFSAAETFALAMRVRDAVTVLGEPSSGHLSDLVGGRLPNGWRYTLSGERYVAADGELYEARGVPVDVDVPLDPDALHSGRDRQLEAALALLPSR